MKNIFLFACLYISAIANAQNNFNIENFTFSKKFTVHFMKSNSHFFELKDTISYDCPEPTRTDINVFCDCIEAQETPTLEDRANFEFSYERRLMDMACVDLTKDSREVATEKISKWWDKYKTKFGCTSISFNISNGSILKFSVLMGFKPFIAKIVGTYEMDINFIDPADNRNLWDYVNDELKEATKNLGAGHSRVEYLKQYQILIEEYGGRSSK